MLRLRVIECENSVGRTVYYVQQKREDGHFLWFRWDNGWTGSVSGLGAYKVMFGFNTEEEAETWCKERLAAYFKHMARIPLYPKEIIYTPE